MFTLGFIMWHVNNQVVEVAVRYDDQVQCADPGVAPLSQSNLCNVTVVVNKDIPAPAYFYYRLSNFYQNHRRYVSSRNDLQLSGQPPQSLAGLADCTPIISVNGSSQPGLFYNPCGLIANSWFVDSFSLSDASGAAVSVFVCPFLSQQNVSSGSLDTFRHFLGIGPFRQVQAHLAELFGAKSQCHRDSSSCFDGVCHSGAAVSSNQRGFHCVDAGGRPTNFPKVVCGSAKWLAAGNVHCTDQQPVFDGSFRLWDQVSGRFQYELHWRFQSIFRVCFHCCRIALPFVVHRVFRHQPNQAARARGSCVAVLEPPELS